MGFIRWSSIRWVNQLMKADSRDWNMELINQIFNKFDAEEIEKIKIPSHEVEDVIAWHYESSGRFTVKSAYNLAYRINRNSTTGASSSANEVGDRCIWDTIWKAKVPQKIKVFGWRVATQSLATNHNAF